MSAAFEIRQFESSEATPKDFETLFAAAAYRERDENLLGARACLAYREGRALARLSYGLAQELAGLSEKAGWIGHYESEDPEAGKALLEHACTQLKALGARIALGPLNGSTWRRYRLALDAQKDPFYGEPENRVQYVRDFEDTGFQERERYESRELSLSAELPWDSFVPRRVLERYGQHIRALRLENYEAELEGVYEESLRSFDANLLYSPISKAAFVELFRPLRNFYDPEFVRLYCDDSGKVLGHVTAYPDGKRIILKTLSCVREARGMGLAHLLSYQVHRLAYERGYQSVVHALMHVSNKSDAMSMPFAKTLRRYALFEKSL